MEIFMQLGTRFFIHSNLITHEHLVMMIAAVTFTVMVGGSLYAANLAHKIVKNPVMSELARCITLLFFGAVAAYIGTPQLKELVKPVSTLQAFTGMMGMGMLYAAIPLLGGSILSAFNALGSALSRNGSKN